MKRKYQKELLANSVTNNKLLWKNIKNVTYSYKNKTENTELLNIMPSPTESVNHVNNFFVNIGKQLAQQIQPGLDPDTQHLIRSEYTVSHSFVLYDTDCHEVDRVLMSLKTGSAPGWDKVTTKFLKYIKMEAVPTLTHLTNLCFDKGVFPEALKRSVITPVHKGESRDDVNNYRPISVLPVISKIVEKLINNRLINYLSKYNLLSPTQFRFRQGGIN